MTSYAYLPQRALILASGEDTTPFLQGIVSNDVTRLPEKKIVYAALLSPQGKFLHDFFLIHTEEGVLIDCEADRTSDLMARFTLYKLRSKVALKKLDSQGVIAVWGGELPPELLRDPRLPQLGSRLYGPLEDIKKQAKAFQETEAVAYDAMRLSLGVPDGSRDMLVDKSFLLECHFEALHGVDFNKGCYVGQEVTARSKFRGQVRKFLYMVQSGGELPAPGTPVLHQGKDIGELRSHALGQGLAILRAEEVEKAYAENSPLTADGKILRVQLPAWASQ